MHKLLERQLRKHFTTGRPDGPEFAAFTRAVGEAYEQADDARLSVERSLELMSNELLERNDQLQADLLEIKRLELELRQADKLRAVGQLAAGVAHEINTPIQFVGDSLSFLQDAAANLALLSNAVQGLCAHLEAGVEASHALQEVRGVSLEIEADYLAREIPLAIERGLEGVARVAQIVLALKEFGRPDQRERGLADLNRGLNNTLTVARSEIRHIADVSLELGDVPPVVGYAGDLNQVFLNLIVNAAHAIEERFSGTSERGLIRVRTWHDGNSVFTEIEDNGKGIALADQPRIFEPFFTTKPVGKGTGQGLAISRSIVIDKHGGALTFDSELGRGTRFLIQLPLVPAARIARSNHASNGGAA